MPKESDIEKKYIHSEKILKGFENRDELDYLLSPDKGIVIQLDKQALDFTDDKYDSEKIIAYFDFQYVNGKNKGCVTYIAFESGVYEYRNVRMLQQETRVTKREILSKVATNTKTFIELLLRLKHIKFIDLQSFLQ